MTDREKIAHLLRRFGLGATPEEIASCEKLGVEGTLGHLVEYDKIDDGVPISPWEPCFEEGKDEVYLDPFRVVSWWSLRMVLTKRPLQEKLALFWHDHFAVSASKVEFGPMMLSYLQVLLKHANGSFPAMLQAVSKDPGMMFWLDTTLNQKGKPNENFAREVMELFTLGIGHYTEKDIQEAARAFTGWGIRYVIYEQGGEKVQEVAKECIRNGSPMTPFCFSPELHDEGSKTILGQTKNWSGDEVLGMLALRPETAKLIAKKLWEYFAYEMPEPAIVERLAKVFLDSRGEIKPMLYAIARSPEFWSEKCVRQRVKGPIDFTVALTRQLGLRDFLILSHGPTPTPMKPMPKPLRDIAGLVAGLGLQQGQLLLYPPTVAGWDWGQAWITSAAMTKRIQLGDLLMGIGGNDHAGAGVLAARVVAIAKPTTAEGVVDGVLTVLDASIPPEKKALMVQACDKAGGAATLAKAETAAPTLAAVLKLLFASPEFQFC